MTRPDVPLSRLYGGFTAGLYGLPDDIARLFTACLRLAERLPAPADADQALAASIEAAVSAAGAGKALPVPRALLAALAEGDQHAAAEQVRSAALAQARSRLQALCVRRGDELVADWLRPAFRAAVEGFAAALALTTPYGDTAEGLLAAPDDARAAFAHLQEHAAAYTAVVGGRTDLLLAGYRSDDAEDAVRGDGGLGRFGVVRNAQDFPPYRGRPPWPTGSAREFLTWAERSGAQLWLPTAAEQSARYREATPPRLHAPLARVR